MVFSLQSKLQLVPQRILELVARKKNQRKSERIFLFLFGQVRKQK